MWAPKSQNSQQWLYCLRNSGNLVLHNWKLARLRKFILERGRTKGIPFLHTLLLYLCFTEIQKFAICDTVVQFKALQKGKTFCSGCIFSKNLERYQIYSNIEHKALNVTILDKGGREEYLEISSVKTLSLLC